MTAVRHKENASTVRHYNQALKITHN